MKRVLNREWEYDHGDYYVGDYITESQISSVSGDTIFLKDKNIFLLNYQFFNTLSITDLTKEKEGIYVIRHSSKDWKPF